MTAVVRGALAALAAVQALVGTWALLTPLAFFDGFPAAGHAWVRLLPPYNEHLVRDVGALSLAVAVVLAAAALTPEPRLVRVALVAQLVYTVPHAMFHVAHLEGFPLADAIAQTVGFVVQVVVPLVLLPLAGRLPARERVPA